MLTIVVLSSDGYKDCWEPMFKSLKMFIPNIEKFEIILSTNNLDYDYPGLDVKVVTHGLNKPWSKRVFDSINEASNETILLLVEDYFLRSNINESKFLEYLELFESNSDVDHIRLVNYGNKFEVKKSSINDLDTIDSNTKNRFMFLPGLWRKEIIKKYLTQFEGPYIAEKTADYRAKIYSHGFYCASMDYISKHGHFYHTSSSGAVYKGKWKPWVIDFLKDLNIQIDLEKRGVGDQAYFGQMKNKTISDLVFKHPISTTHSVLSLLSLWLRQKLGIIK